MTNFYKAIIVSNIFDIAVSSILGIFVGALFFNFDVETARPYLLTLGGFVSVMAGYLSARMAGQRPLLAGALSSILCVAGGLFLFPAGNVLKGMLEIAVSPILGTLGGFIFSKWKK